jgi:tyrosine-specific transport protein
MSLKNAIGGVALLAGTAIGAAILALPVSTAHLGFVQTIGIYVVCWFFMTMGALYLLETNLLTGYGSNLISMAEKTLGKPGKAVVWVVYLLLLYTLTSAYLSGAGAWIHQGMTQYNTEMSPFVAALCATFVTLLVIILGTTVTDWVNRFLMIGLIGCFVSLLFGTMGHVQSELLFSGTFAFDAGPLPIIITAFGSAIVIPSITEYLHGNVRQLFWVVLIGSIIPLIVYILWEITMTGIIPFAELLNIQQHGHPVTDVPVVLQEILHNLKISRLSFFFSIFALITSLLGVSLSLFDFLADGLQLKKRSTQKLILALVAFVPPLIFIFFYPQGFTLILSFAGIFVSLLLGIFPVLMAWQGRYRLQEPRELQIIGGKFMMLLTLAFFIVVICIECVNQWKMFMSPVG